MVTQSSSLFIECQTQRPLLELCVSIFSIDGEIIDLNESRKLGGSESTPGTATQRVAAPSCSFHVVFVDVGALFGKIRKRPRWRTVILYGIRQKSSDSLEKVASIILCPAIK